MKNPVLVFRKSGAFQFVMTSALPCLGARVSHSYNHSGNKCTKIEMKVKGRSRRCRRERPHALRPDSLRETSFGRLKSFAMSPEKAAVFHGHQKFPGRPPEWRREHVSAVSLRRGTKFSSAPFKRDDDEKFFIIFITPPYL